MNLLYEILFGWILATIAAGYNPVTVTQNGVPLAAAPTRTTLLHQSDTATITRRRQ